LALVAVVATGLLGVVGCDSSEPGGTTDSAVVTTQTTAPAEAPSLFPFSNAEDEWGYIDKTGAVVIEPQYPAAGRFSEGFAPVVLEGTDEYGYINESGVVVIQPQFAIASPFSEGLAAVRLGAVSRDGYIDSTGSFIIQPEYRQAEPFFGDLAAVELDVPDYTRAYIDKTGKVIWHSEPIPPTSTTTAP
jgi:hypothetical protein